MIEDRDDLQNRLAKRLAEPLPGRRAQARFAPELSYGRHSGPPPRHARRAAVVALLDPSDNSWSIPLTLRPDHLPDHAGQVCFPGGALDPGETYEAAALRELHEELGVETHEVQLAGMLSPLYVFASNFWVTPLVAVARQPLAFAPNPAEVAELVMLPKQRLLDPKFHGATHIERGGVRFRAPHILCAGHRIWGATSMMLGELRAILQDIDEAAEAGGT